MREGVPRPKNEARDAEVKYPRLVWSDGKLVPEHTLSETPSKSEPVATNIPRDFAKEGVHIEEVETVNLNRRRFLRSALAVAVAGVAGKEFLKEGSETLVESVPLEVPARIPFEPKTILHEENMREKKEVVGDVETIEEQLEKDGAIRNLKGALEVHAKEHFAYLTDNPDGVRDMEIAVENMKSLDMKKFVAPFEKRELPQQLAYMIAIQESRGKTSTISWANARGITGIMPATLRLLGYGNERIASLTKKPYFGSKLAAKHLEADRNIFGDDISMLLHSYNGGAGLFGFTASTPRESRTPDAFYVYMERYINTKYQELRNSGYPYKIVKKDTLKSIAEKFDVSVDELCDHNEITRNTILTIGDEIKVPVTTTSQAITLGLRKEFEVLNYAFEIQAKYDALKELDLLVQLEAGLSIQSSLSG